MNSKVTKKIFDNDECPICYSSPQVKKAHTDSCGHVCCYQCLEKWSRIKKECPVCKVEFSKIIRIKTKKSKLISVAKRAVKIVLGIVAIPVVTALGLALIAPFVPIALVAGLVAAPIVCSYFIVKEIILPELKREAE